MSTAMSTFIFRMIVCLVAAWIVYVLDRRFGKSWYRKWYDMSHEEKLGTDVIRGFVCGRNGKTQCRQAILLSLLVMIGLMLTSHDTALSWLINFLVGLVVCLFGFLSGPFMANLWGKRDRVYNTIDRYEAGEINPAEQVREVSKKFRVRIFGWIGWLRVFWNGPKSASPTSAPVVPSVDTQSTTPLSSTQTNVPVEQEKDSSPEDKIRQFTGG